MAAKDNGLTVLVTGVGAPGTRGTLHCLRNNPAGERVRTAGVDISPDPVGRYLVDVFTSAPAPEDEHYTGKILQFCRAEHVQVIVPQTTREIDRLSRDLPLFTDAGVKVMVAGHRELASANNKLSALRAFEAAGLPVPAYRAADSTDAIRAAAFQLGYPGQPVVVKLPVSNGMRGLRILRQQPVSFTAFVLDKPDTATITLDEFCRICETAERLPELLVCEYLPGDEYSVDAFRGALTEVAVARRRVVIRSGISFVTDVEHDSDIEAQTLGGAEALGLTGVFGFQFKRNHDGKARLLECNPRVQGTMVASALAGANVIWMGVQEILGNIIDQKPVTPKSARFSRFWGGLSVLDGKVTEI
jgi:carbamoyl-phosphate synthase large subunit